MTPTAQFNRAICVQRGYLIEDVKTLDDVLEYLESWPQERRGLAYETLYKACREAAAGRFPVSAVAENFRRFLKKADMLAETHPIRAFTN
ncbi:DUF982 domain-containing protein (plasmid) [Rhizobium acidisoli]|uniref:DUF982 domain-containing protein n=1 Tax=Rhizobium acidisoli TaxID=1538158 RepID=A0AAE5WR74_9HYPH|nr:DUF982 domain-containing protein [Rhizobium acidisoli]KPH04952.1 hypothetical protein AOG23_30155 [Rhizobium acidisoli]QAS81003.1 DUF982 domain-containing protein [Rhizobium acidisoli]